MRKQSARARKEQTLKRYGEYGITIETKTFVSDVPMTDCFYLTDIICIGTKLTTYNKDHNHKPYKNSQLLLNIRFDIVFVKSTYFRSLITRTAKSEVHSFMEDYAIYMITKLKEHTKEHQKHDDKNKGAPTKTSSLSSQKEEDITTQGTAKAEAEALSSSPLSKTRIKSSSSISTTTNKKNDNWWWSWWKILSFILLAVIALLLVQIRNEIKLFRIDVRQQQQQQQQQHQCESESDPATRYVDVD